MSITGVNSSLEGGLHEKFAAKTETTTSVGHAF